MTDLSANPLIGLGGDFPFDRIAAEHVEPAISKLIADTQAALDAIGSSNEPPAYENTLGALEAASEPLERAMTVVGHLESVATNVELRAAYNVIRPQVSALYTSIALDPALYARLKAFAKSAEARTLEPTKKRFLEKELRSFRRYGAELDEKGKTVLRALDVELATVTTKYGQNLLDETNDFELYLEDEGQLEGLPQSARKAARSSAEAKEASGWRFTLQAPSLNAVLKYLKDASIRETIWRAYNTRASSGERDNRPLIARILELRKQKASLLGYESFADFVLEERMAKNGSTARSFIEDLGARAAGHFSTETDALLAFRRELEGDDAPLLESWDIGYYSELLRRSEFDFDEEQVRPYLGVERVLRGLFDVVGKLYGVRVEPWADAPVWHEDVRTFRMLDEHGTLRARFYVDLFPRESKRGGAWMNGFITGGPTQDDGAFVPHLGLFCANVTEPVGDEAAQLTHREVETLFHEFGHLMHLCLSDVKVRSLAGTHVAWDFVELPSQIMENWTWERSALDLFARNVETDEPIPEELFQKMLAARTFRAASTMMRQLGFASADLALHIDFDPSRDGDPVSYAREKMAPFAPAPLPDDYAMICGFTHLFASPVGYAAAYYSYKWAEVLDADAFTRFRERGVFDRETGNELRNKILSRGDSADPSQLFRDFMGREPNVQALLERSGLSGLDRA